jgi:glycosyltransferase involved in cell wall biosynthesis
MHTFEVGRRMAARGHRVQVVTGDPTGDLPLEEIMGGMRVKRVPVYPKSSDLFFAPAVYSEVLRAEADVIHIQGYHTLMPPLATLAALRKNAAFVMTFHSGGHSSWLRNRVRGAQLAALRALIVRADKLIAVSRFEAERFSSGLRIPLDRFVVAPNGAEIGVTAAATQKDPATPLILSVGRLERYKGHHRVIKAFKDILAERPGARLRVLGEGPFKPQLLDLTRKLGLEGYVAIGGIPPAERGQMATALESSSVVVLLSDYEAHPVAALEAISLGLPVLASNSTGFVEMADKGLLQGIDPDAPPRMIAKAILKLVDGGRASAPPIHIPNWDDCANNLLEIYHQVVEARKVREREFQFLRAPRAVA